MTISLREESGIAMVHFGSHSRIFGACTPSGKGYLAMGLAARQVRSTQDLKKQSRWNPEE